MMPRPPSPPAAFPPPYPIHNPSISTQFDRKQKQRAMMGITAGAEDVKYQAKYRELKKKVKEIESDNDKLYFKLLLAKKNIRRMNLERAILYERLAAVPPTPGRQTQELPSEPDPIFRQQPPVPPEHARPVDPNDREIVEYMRARPNARLIEGLDGRVVAIEDTPTPASLDARGVPVPAGPPPPHGIPLVQGFRHDSGPGYDPERQLPPPPPMIPLLQHVQDGAPEPSSVTNDRHGTQYTYPQSRPPPPPHASHSHSNSSHHSRSSSARPDLEAVTGGNSRAEPPPSAYSVHTRSPNMLAEPPAEHRSRRHDMHDHPHPHGHPPPLPPVQIPPPQSSIPGSPTLLSPGHRRGGPHNHQRIGPGANIHRERDPERDRERQQQLEYERELEREREEQRAVDLQHRLALEAQEEEALWAEEEARARGISRSGSPGSAVRTGGGGGGGGSPRDASLPAAGQAHYHERGARGYPAPHVSNLLGVDRNRERERERDRDRERDADERGPSLRDRMAPAELARASSAESRKRTRDEMEVDDRYEPEGRAAAHEAVRSAAGSRGGKRTHSEEAGDGGHPGRGDGLPDERMDEA